MVWEWTPASAIWESVLLPVKPKEWILPCMKPSNLPLRVLFQGGILEKGVAEGWISNCRFPEEQSFWEETFNFKHQVEIPSEVMQKLRKPGKK